MALRMKNFNIFRVHWKIQFLGGGGVPPPPPPPPPPPSDIPVHTMIFLRVSLPMKDARLHQIYFSFIITEDSSRLLFWNLNLLKLKPLFWSLPKDNFLKKSIWKLSTIKFFVIFNFNYIWFSFPMKHLLFIKL